MRRALFLALALAAYAAAPAPENDFAAAYNAWIIERNAHGAGVVSLREARLWREVRSRWRALDQTVRY